MSVYIPNILLAVPRNPITAVGLPIALGFLSGSPSSKVANSNWYHNLHAPPGQPPREVFPFAWSLLYLSMGYASHVAVKALDSSVVEGHRNALSTGLALYYAQLVELVAHQLRTLQTGLALVDSVLLTGTTWYMTKLLDRPTNGEASYYLFPYCAWLAYATYLNAGIWWLNRDGKVEK
ncbi:hypothetical protein NLJ89_g7178 [Agrocybe chaxingu]|uniref:Uncharacterized protein n=1 Tax=Agrocybe chaxingu TaxID=84603 RepID=A0A9W8MVB0_9AGAR|nr:hypothetical protein NLJ89_g7178 [Agrocybe chaxingu]